ncbi:uncharacterized protein LOC130749800 [Lotus japonicus]|uniref:uncharacterized protein LOC130749800 n=1 Tax=Lotus japonicus TaxID=34305 RepID=UPI0025826CD1|nr:uncharacterized protein LOC130749800 [Lotus japonicus]
MAGFARRKRVTDLFDDEARARLFGGDHRQLSGVSSGSEHSGDGDSPCLSELVHGFLEDNSGDDCDCDSDIPVMNEFDSERVDSVAERADSVEDLLRLNAASTTVEDGYKNLLQQHVSEAVVKFSFVREMSDSLFRRNVMSFLRENGHNAAICKTRWESSGGGITAGNYEFIDVVRSGPSTWQSRYFVDVDFAGQFEIARPTSRYSEILSFVPGVFVGTAEEVKRTVSVLCGAAKRCFKSRGRNLPPWRKNRYMQNKWFGPYRRTVNPVQGNPVQKQRAHPAFSDAMCRFVGFDDAVSEVTKRGAVFVRTR